MREGTAFQLSGDESVNTDGVALEDETDMPEADGSSTEPEPSMEELGLTWKRVVVSARAGRVPPRYRYCRRSCRLANKPRVMYKE